MLREDPPSFYVTFSDRGSKIRQLERLGYTRHEGGPPYAPSPTRKRDGQRVSVRW